MSHESWSDVTPDLFEDNTFLTRELTKIPHKKFIFISSIYEAKDSPYGVTKRLSEIIVKQLCDEYLILRPSALLGKEMKKNTFQKILSGEDIALTSNTIMNYVLYEDVLNAIKSDVYSMSNRKLFWYELLGNKVMIFFGNISYAIYCFHEPMFRTIQMIRYNEWFGEKVPHPRYV